MKRSTRLRSWFVAAATAGLLFPSLLARPARAADHGDSPNVAGDQACDIADVYAFLDPNDNNRVVIAATFRGFIASGENVNFGVFDPAVNYRFEFETTGDAKMDRFIDVRFSPKETSTSTPQTATLFFSKKKTDTFSFPVTVSSIDPTPHEQVVTHDAQRDIDCFAGMVDDPFFFDIPANSRFIASIRAGSPDPSVFNRGRDSFAGYNILCIALRFPKSYFDGTKDNILGVDFLAQRASQQIDKTGAIKVKGKFKNVDRMGNPAVNVVVVPFTLKNEYNTGSTEDDAKGRFVQQEAANLQSLGTLPPQIEVLANAAINRGDMLKLNLTIPNSGLKGGTNPEASFPNGRRLADDVVDILLTIINNNAPLGDKVDGSDVPPQDHFPFFALPQQPRDNGVLDDNTRN
jgi:hypothetical protein